MSLQKQMDFIGNKNGRLRNDETIIAGGHIVLGIANQMFDVQKADESQSSDTE